MKTEEKLVVYGASSLLILLNSSYFPSFREFVENDLMSYLYFGFAFLWNHLGSIGLCFFVFSLILLSYLEYQQYKELKSSFSKLGDKVYKTECKLHELELFFEDNVHKILKEWETPYDLEERMEKIEIKINEITGANMPVDLDKKAMERRIGKTDV
jgi:hypothetical protein